MDRAIATAAVAGGLLYVLAFPGIDLWWLAPVSWVAPLWMLIRRNSGDADASRAMRRAAAVGVWMGVTAHLLVYHWVVHLLQTFAFLPLPAAVAGWMLLCLAQGASHGVATAVAWWLYRRWRWPLALALPAGAVLMDFAYPMLFPSYIANAVTAAPVLLQTADLGGPLLVAALVPSLGGALVDVMVSRKRDRQTPWRIVGGVTGVWVAALTYGVWRLASYPSATPSGSETLKVGVVQSGVGAADHLVHKAREEEAHLVRTTGDLHARGAELVVWPEGALNRVVTPSTRVVDSVLDGLPQPLLFGATRIERGPTGRRLPYNSAFLSDATGKVVGSYDKTRLLALGEYIPGGDLFPQIYEAVPYASHFGRGRTKAPLVLELERDGRRSTWALGTFICYEDILPGFVRSLVTDGAPVPPDLLVNITNDSWYGDTTEPWIHLSLARLRAVEHRRWLVRSTNTGISAVVDAAGRIVARTETYRPETMLVDVPRLTGTTLYQRVGDALGWIVAGVLAALLAVDRRRKQSPAT